MFWFERLPRFDEIDKLCPRVHKKFCLWCFGKNCETIRFYSDFCVFSSWNFIKFSLNL